MSGEKKTALQLTMSHINNYGSVLQAYALQHIIDSIPGWNCKNLNIAQTVYDRYLDEGKHPGNFISRNLQGLFEKGPSFLWRKLRSFFCSKFKPNFDYVFRDFVNKNLNQTTCIESRDALYASLFDANLYITGSDQTLNPKFTCADPIWFFDFVSCGRDGGKPHKITYASSIASSSMTTEFLDIYRHALSSYDAISLREKSGVALAASMGIQASHCVDPTVLLGKDFWRDFSTRGRLKLPPKFILCYNLTYYVDPYPVASRVERKVSRVLGIPIVYLDLGYLRFSSNFWSRTVPVSVEDFVQLFFSAAIVLTSSYHGTVFALLAQKPFVTYVATEKAYDSRAMDLLESCSATHHAMVIGDSLKEPFDIDRFGVTAETTQLLQKMRLSSLKWLRESVNSVK